MTFMNATKNSIRWNLTKNFRCTFTAVLILAGFAAVCTAHPLAVCPELAEGRAADPLRARGSPSGAEAPLSEPEAGAEPEPAATLTLQHCRGRGT
jgi:hypothetical protein